MNIDGNISKKIWFGVTAVIFVYTAVGFERRLWSLRGFPSESKYVMPPNAVRIGIPKQKNVFHLLSLKRWSQNVPR